MTARGFVAASCTQDSSRLDESKCAPCHVGHYGAADDASNVIQLGKRRARRLRSPVRNDARDKGLDLIEECIGSRVTKVELAALFDASPKDVTKMLEGEVPFPAEAFVLVALRRADLAVEVVVTYVRFLVEKAVDTAAGDRVIDIIISRLEAVREARKSKKPS